MKIHLIEPNYVFNHKYFKIVKFFIGIYLLFLLRYTTYKTDDSLLKFESTVELVSMLFIILSSILILLNSILYSKIGKLHINYDTITLSKNGWVKTIDLKTIQSLRIERIHGKEYILKIDKMEFPIELNASEFNKLKQLQTVTKISFQKVSFFTKLKRKVLSFSEKNQAFMDEMSQK